MNIMAEEVQGEPEDAAGAGKAVKGRLAKEGAGKAAPGQAAAGNAAVRAEGAVS